MSSTVGIQLVDYSRGTMRISRYFLALIILIATQAQAAKCDEKCLRATLDGYMQALVRRDHTKLALAPNYKYTENGKPLQLGQGLWEHASKLDAYGGSFTDAASEQAVYWGIVHEGANPTIVSLRLGIKDRKIAEIEHIVARKGSHALFAPQALTKLHPHLTSSVDRKDRLTRDKLIAIADTYMEGIEKHSSKIVKAADDCQRIENGVQTTNQPGRTSRNCQESADLLTYIKAVKERRFPVVDVEKGIVFATFVFDIPGEQSSANDSRIATDAQVAARLRQPRMLLLTEWFKIQKGAIQHIEAVMHNLPHGSTSGWQ